jgi:hypothetical protein
MKSFKNLLIALLVISIITPSIASAAWWNPTTWTIWSFFKKIPTPTMIQTEVKIDTQVSASTSAPTSTPEKKVTPQPKPVIPKTTIAQPVIETEQTATFSTEDRAAIKINATKIIDSRDKIINSLKEIKNSYSNTKYPEEYADLSLAIDKTISIFESEKALAKLLVDASDKAPATSRGALINNYTDFLAIVNETNAEAPVMFFQIANLKELSNAVVKARIELEVINELSTQYGVGTQSSATIASDRQSLTKKADDYIKSLVDAQEKLKESRKDKIILFLKVIISTSAR